ncbi:hypothetical protein BS47DRAFT_1022819 [Hydnum rufescens UP504]|uniref:Uncharacterized protein n=1 Tax=Hydnum rufescens UP504 TaxID=1448309 RepID=A0A9P6AVW9_9AGAM|nr:hypothetical protein BS47DRAFT_1022819 [Hydnum rufescens UP504]
MARGDSRDLSNLQIETLHRYYKIYSTVVVNILTILNPGYPLATPGFHTWSILPWLIRPTRGLQSQDHSAPTY